MELVPPADLTEPLPDSILDVLAELYWEERINDAAIEALRAEPRAIAPRALPHRAWRP